MPISWANTSARNEALKLDVKINVNATGSFAGMVVEGSDVVRGGGATVVEATVTEVVTMNEVEGVGISDDVVVGTADEELDCAETKEEVDKPMTANNATNKTVVSAAVTGTIDNFTILFTLMLLRIDKIKK